jgi:hypothetical protein
VAVALDLLLVTIAAGFLTWVIVHAIQGIVFWPGPFVDWRTYENAVARLSAGGSIYAPDQLAGPYRLTKMLLVGYAYPPATVPLLVPFVGYPFGLAAWITLNLGLLLTALWTMVSRTWPTRRAAAFSVTLVALALYAPFQDGMIAMNVNIGLAGVIGWVSVGLGDRVAGVLGGVLAIVKVFAGAIALATTGSKVRAVGWAVATAIALALVTLPVVGIQSWSDFLIALTGSVPDCRGFNSSIACQLQPWVGMSVGTLVGIAIGAMAAAGLLMTRQPFLMCVLASVVVMAPANNMHFHYWTIGFVVALAALARLSDLRAARPARRDRVDDAGFAARLES